VKPQLKEEYINSGKVKFHYINLVVINQNSNLAARASEYVQDNDPENFWNFHSTLFDLRGQLTRNSLINTVTETTNITEQEINDGLSDEKYIDEVKADRKIANGNGVTSTPTVYVNGERVGNDYESIKSAIENNLEDAK
jgi:protein-disulfide isomerase